MLISYPFLPARGANTSDADYEQSILNFEILNSGVYPSSQEREWHGGIHILAPTSTEPVRAIADGTLVAYRLNTELTKERPEDADGRIDNSFVLIRHETESDSLPGSNGAETPVKVVYYSLYMHLMNTAEMTTQGVDHHQIHRAISESGQAVKLGNNAKIYRKDIIGFPGESYSTTGMIHFEIFVTDDQLNGFFVDSQNAAQIGTKGMWGDSYYVVKAGSPAVAAHPGGHSKIGRRAFPLGNAGTANQSKDLFVRIAFRNGTKYTTTWVAGEQDQPPTLLTSEEGVADADYEYDMYSFAMALYPSCPSAGMELLRFGKVIGPDAGRLAANEKHNWQFITYANGQQGYLDLADSTVVKQVLSDADFPYWLGWQKGIGGFFADSGQCSMHGLLDVLKVSHDGERTDAARQQLHDYFSDPEHRHLRDWVRRLIVQYPSEWDKSNNTRCTKLKEKDGFGPGHDGPYFGNDDEYGKHIQFVESLQWWGDVGLGGSNVWHFHPFGFIQHFRKCGWLNLDEMIGLMPKGTKTYQEMANVLTSGQNITRHKMVMIIPPKMQYSINQTTRKYGLNSQVRKAQFWGQLIVESDHLQTVREYASGMAYDITVDPAKAQQLGNTAAGDGPRYKGRGIIQSTGKGAYMDYGKYRNFDMITGVNNARFETDGYSASDSAGLYWVSEQTRDKRGKHWILDGFINISRRADATHFSGWQDAAGITESVSSVTRQINRAELALSERANYFKHAYSALSELDSAGIENIKK